MRRTARPLSLLALSLVVLLTACGDDDVTPMTDGGLLDTGVPLDSRVDGLMPVCALASDCDDGAFCNGPETCSPGATGADAMGCVPGTDPCTGGACSEMANTCSTCGTSDVDGDGVDAVACGGTDCDDADASRYPGATETCDADDEDCNDTTYGARDTDGDGAIDAACCNGTVCGPDCDDTNASVGPTGTEACNGLDDNCNGAADEGVQVTVFVDADRDGHGNAAMSAMACAGVAGYSAYGDDCDDTTALRSPSLPEFCDTLDNDCDAATAAVGAATVPWYRDSDGDGFGDPAVTVTACSPPAMHVLLGTDCNDTDPMVHPAAAERCNALDDNCDGFANYVVVPGNFEDDDADGFIDGMCVGGDDCDDRNPAIHPGGTEICNGRDDDCDMTVDESGGTWSYYWDGDGDGYGTGAAMPDPSCTIPAMMSPYAGDCDDFDNARSPGTPETCNAIDDNCSGTVDESPAASGSCARTGSIMTCTAGACAILACAGTSRDCNATAADGCEADIVGDANNCGACGNACAGVGASCEAGVCVASTVIDLGVGAETLCVTLDTGGVYCQGRVPTDLGRTTSTTTFGPVAALDDAVATAVGREGGSGHPHFCALRTGGRVSCWGWNDEGQLGDGTTTGRPEAAAVPGITDAVQVVVGNAYRSGMPSRGSEAFSCALRSTGGVLCWGANDRGQLGRGTTMPSLTPTTVMGVTDAVSISAHAGYVCAVRMGGAVVCWGDNRGGELVTGGAVAYPVPTTIASFAGSAEVVAVDGLPCRRSTAGVIECRPGSCLGPPGPAVTGFTTPAQVAGSGGYLCERESGGTVRCTTRVICGAAGNVLSPIVGLDGVVQIGVASGASPSSPHRACARLTNGEIWCWNTYDSHPQRAPGFPVCATGTGTALPPFTGPQCAAATGACITACLAGPAPYRACVYACAAADATAVACGGCVIGGIAAAGCLGVETALDCCQRQYCATGSSAEIAACVATSCPREVSILDACLDVDPTLITRCYR